MPIPSSIRSILISSPSVIAGTPLAPRSSLSPTDANPLVSGTPMSGHFATLLALVGRVLGEPGFGV
ncbi:MAG: hypothetical protein KDB21_04200, partial [Acidimicrobiales bacterium]|nr:hypothetical protein [Acidimicrobiales bacterium]